MLATIYDPLVWVLCAGRERAVRRATLAAGGVGPGDAVLDVGCGTGALVVAARELTGPGVRVVGMDPSVPMLARARRRGNRAGVHVELVDGEAGELPFPEASFDVVMLSLVMHYLSPDQKTQAAGEARRVLREGGRAVVVDFGRSHGTLGRLQAHLMLHGGVAANAPDLGALLSAAGLAEVSRQPSPIGALHIVRGTRRDH